MDYTYSLANFDLSSFWYTNNIPLLRQIFGNIQVGEGYAWIFIERFNMPPVIRQRFTNLLIITPGTNYENMNGYKFYLGSNVRRKDGKTMEHLYLDDSYNDMQSYGYARLSLHLKSFRPSVNVLEGDTILNICDTVYNFLAQEEGA